MINFIIMVLTCVALFLATFFWLPWWLCLVGATLTLILLVFTQWDKMFIFVPLDTAWVYTFAPGNNNDQLADPVIFWPGNNCILIGGIHRFEEGISFKRDFSATVNVVGITKDGARINCVFVANLKIDPNNLIAWIRNGDTEREREEEVQKNFANALGQLISHTCREMTAEELLTGTWNYSDGTSTSGINHLANSVIAFYSRENSIERDFGFQVKSITPGNISATADLAKAMDHTAIMELNQAIVNEMIEHSKKLDGETNAMSSQKAWDHLKTVSDEVHAYHISGDPEIIAAFARMAGGNSALIDKLDANHSQNKQTEENRNRSNRRRRGKGGG